MNDIKQLIPQTSAFPQAKKSRDNKTVKKVRTFADFLPPEERGYQTIPNPDILQGMIGRALEALKHGVFWDRGSILNIRA